MSTRTATIRVVDSHTGGEPTRIVISGGPVLPQTSMADRLKCLKQSFDDFRTAVVNEPRGSDAMVGGLLCEPVNETSAAGVIFFNNVGYLGMCGHGTIGLMATLAYLERIKPGSHEIETPVGTVTAHLHESGEVTLKNVASYRYAKGVEVDVEGYGKVTGDVAWGGNWFFLVNDPPFEIHLRNIEPLTDYTWRIRQALVRQNITGALGQEIDHVEVFAKPVFTGPDSTKSNDNRADSKNFVLCPGKAYDRSPCGTGTSAKMACLYADGKLRVGDVWRQESVVGTIFEGSISVEGEKIYPQIKGSAFVNSEANLILDDRDPFCWGIRP